MVKSENQVEIYQTLTVLAKETDVALFQKRQSNFTKLWMPIEPEFITYFTKYYENRAGITKHAVWYYDSKSCYTVKWAKCYRHFNHGDTDTNMYLER